MTEEQLIEAARCEEQGGRQERQDGNDIRSEQENAQDTMSSVSSTYFPFYSEAFVEQIRQIEYERDRMLNQLISLSDTYYLN